MDLCHVISRVVVSLAMNSDFIKLIGNLSAKYQH